METSVDALATPDYGWNTAAAELSHAYLEPVVMRAVSRVAQERKSPLPLRVFDAGCGNGALLRAFAARGYAVAGCDASPSGIEHAGDGSNSLDVRLMSVYDGLADSFGSGWDVVVATEVIEHLYAPRQFIRQARRLLKPNGHLLLTTPYHGYFKNLALAATGALDAHFTALWDGGHIKFWSYRTLRQLLAEFGFSRFQFFGAGRCFGLWKSMVVVARLSG